MKDMELGINIDHVATLRQVRGTDYPDPTTAVKIVEKAGADLITLHLREDRRHISDRDVEIIRAMVSTRMNLEMAATDEMTQIACAIKPHDVCIVPERREELTTEGGLDVCGKLDLLRSMVDELRNAGIRVSMFIDPDASQIEASKSCGAEAIEIHTGTYADSTDDQCRELEFSRIVDAACFAHDLGLKVNAGHGLNYENVSRVANISKISELNIGHSIIAEAVFVGLYEAVSRMKQVIVDAVSE
ncbi:MAG: pyridoxine 5'-phosphate synthase [Acidiferrobacteraceae bacterium]|nr:pyridoxine 5'-phosphate synthase [Acidiferrobacteraceae bacterium]